MKDEGKSEALNPKHETNSNYKISNIVILMKIRIPHENQSIYVLHAGSLPALG
jgi:hypothetical protein